MAHDPHRPSVLVSRLPGGQAQRHHTRLSHVCRFWRVRLFRSSNSRPTSSLALVVETSLRRLSPQVSLQRHRQRPILLVRPHQFPGTGLLCGSDSRDVPSVSFPRSPQGLPTNDASRNEDCLSPLPTLFSQYERPRSRNSRHSTFQGGFRPVFTLV